MWTQRLIFTEKLAEVSRSHGHLQQHHLPVLGGVRLADVSLEPRGTEERGRTLLAREDLLLALFSSCVEHICTVAPSQRFRQQLVPHRVPQAVFVSDLRRREARAAEVAREHVAGLAGGLVGLAEGGGGRRPRGQLVGGEVLLQVSLSAELLPAVAALVNFFLRQRLDKRRSREGLRLLRGQLGALLRVCGQYEKTRWWTVGCSHLLL